MAPPKTFALSNGLKLPSVALGTVGLFVIACDIQTDQTVAITVSVSPTVRTSAADTNFRPGEVEKAVQCALEVCLRPHMTWPSDII